MITFSDIKKEYLPFLKDWRNRQRDILRQVKLLTDSDQKKWFKKIQTDKNQKLFGILENGKFIGYCGLTPINHDNKRAEISFLVNPIIARQAKHYEAVFLVVLEHLKKYGFKTLKLHKIFAETVQFRKHHMKILEKSSLVKEAVLKEHYFKHGKFQDTIVHSIFTRSNSVKR